jgi:putative colanic acid biosynthesis glycosyltransferase WcaI
MLILVTSSYYWPELTGNAPYVTGMAEHYASLGHDVVVTTVFPHYPEWKPLMPRRLMLTEHHHGVEIRRRWNYIPAGHTAARRALYDAIIFASGLTALPSRRRPDVIIGISPTSSCAHAAVASRMFRRPYALVFHDIIGQAALQTGMKGGARVAGSVSRLELALARGAARVAVYSDGMREYFVKRGVTKSAIQRVRPWTLRWAPAEDPKAARARLGWGPEDFIALHAGNMGLKQGLDNLLAAGMHIDESDVKIVLAGEGNQRAHLEHRRAALGADNILFVSPQKWGHYESMLQAADVLIVNQRGTVADMAFPSKLTSYFPAGRPIIAAVAAQSDTAREIESAGGGVVVPADDPAALAAEILNLKRARSRAEHLGKAGRLYAAGELTPSRILACYEDFLDAVAAAT